MNLNEIDLQWLHKKWSLIRRSQQKADNAAREWDDLNNRMNDYLNRQSIMDIVQRDKIKGENLTMKGHLATHAWHANEAQRHIDDVNLFLRMKELGVL